MSERPPPLRTEALALARWTALLMGWVWLGAQGQRLGWSVASGVLPVALWWAMRGLLAHTMPSAPSTRSRSMCRAPLATIAAA